MAVRLVRYHAKDVWRSGVAVQRRGIVDFSSFKGSPTKGLVQVANKKDPEIPVPLLHTVSMRCLDARVTQTFYKNCFNFGVLHSVSVLNSGYSCIFMGPQVSLHYEPMRAQVYGTTASLRELAVKELADTYDSTHAMPQPGTMDAHDYVFHYTGTMLEFIELHGEVGNHRFKLGSGNDQESLGFGGVTILVDDLAQTCRALHVNKSTILAEPTEKDPSVLCVDPNGYHLRILERVPTMLYQTLPKRKAYSAVVGSCRLRVKEPYQSVRFYEMFFTMVLVCKREFKELGLTRYYLCCKRQLEIDAAGPVPLPDAESDEAYDMVRILRVAFLELQHHHGTEDDPDFRFHSGNTPPLGFAHLGFLVEKVDAVVSKCVDLGIYVLKNRGEGAFPQSAYIMDPDGYWIEIYPRCMRDIIIREENDADRQLTREDHTS